MKKIILSFVFLFVLIVHASAYLLSYGIGFEVSNHLYKEHGLMKLTGTKHGLRAEYVDRRFLSDFKNSNIAFNVTQIRFMTGDVDYDGDLQGEVKTPHRLAGLKTGILRAGGCKV